MTISWKNEIMPENIPHEAEMFLTGMILSGFGDGIIMTIAQLYFISIGLTSIQLGSVSMLKAIGTALVTIPAGYLADRFGKRKMLIIGFAVFTVGIFTLLLTRSLEMLSIGMFLIGLADATYVVLGPLYSSFFTHDDMDKAFGLRGFLNIISVSIGSLLGFIPPMLVRDWGFTHVDAYWSLFAFATVFFMARLPFFLLASRSLNGSQLGKKFTISPQSRELLFKFILITALSTVGYEVFFNFFPLFLNTKFNAESDALGVLFSLSWAASALANVLSPRISGRLGTVNTISLAFALCVPFYFGLTWAPSLTILSLLYLIRRGIANLASPLTSSLMMKSVPDEEKSTVNGIVSTAQRISSASSTWLGGWLIAKYTIDAPIYLGATLYLAHAAAMYLLFRNLSPSQPIAVPEITVGENT